MKTVLKVILIVALLLIAIKLSPIIFIAALAGLLVATVLGALGLSLLAAFAAIVIALSVALSPIWIPVLVIVGVISLIKRADNQPQSPVTVA
jgi:hypothetical protein